MDNNSEEKFLQRFIFRHLDKYIGLISTVTENMWVYDKENEKIIQREIKYVPALYKIFDEILINAAENKQRDAKMDTIRIKINANNNTISVWNNGKGVPVVFHKKENMHEPTIMFNKFFTSLNRDDSKKKFIAGENGLGAKLCNLFSNRFTVETASTQCKKSFKQTWSDNMSKSTEPKIKKNYHGDDFTHVTFSPDLKRFNMEKLDKDTVDLMTRRAYDLAGSLNGVKVYLNDTLIPVKNFEDYCQLYIRGEYDETGKPLKLIYQSCGLNWEVGLTLSTTEYKQMSFVNSIATTDGGTHVDYVTKLVIRVLSDLIEKERFQMDITDGDIKQSIWIFVNCSIDNPVFNSPKKERMRAPNEITFGPKFEMSKEFENLIAKIGVIESFFFAEEEFKADLELPSSPEPGYIRIRLDDDIELEFEDESYWCAAYNY